MQNAWQADHEVWLKDASQWEKEHVIIREAINALTHKLKTYDVVVDYHKHQINDHKELIGLHGDAMNWHQINVGNHAQKRISDLIDLEDEAHRNERDVHAKLKKLHQDIVAAALDAVYQLGKLL